MLNKELLYKMRKVSMYKKLTVGTEEFYINNETKFNDVLAKICGCSTRTIYRWLSDNDVSPNRANIEALNEYFGADFNSSYSYDYVKEDQEKMEINYIAKNAINETYKTIINYLNAGNIEEEDFYKLINELESHQLSIPNTIYEKIESFIKQEIEPLTYNYQEEFANTFDKNLGSYDANGSFKINDEEALLKILFRYCEIIHKVKIKFFAFSNSYLKFLITD